MPNTAARSVLHGVLPFAPELIDAVLAEISPVALSENEIEMWDAEAVKTACRQRAGIKASFWEDGHDNDFEIVSDDEIEADELAEVEAIEAECEARLAASKQRWADLRAQLEKDGCDE